MQTFDLADPYDFWQFSCTLAAISHFHSRLLHERWAEAFQNNPHLPFLSESRTELPPWTTPFETAVGDALESSKKVLRGGKTSDDTDISDIVQSMASLDVEDKDKSRLSKLRSAIQIIEEKFEEVKKADKKKKDQASRTKGGVDGSQVEMRSTAGSETGGDIIE